MLNEHYAAGVEQALAHYGIKTAAVTPAALGTFGNKALGFGKGLARQMVGSPDIAFKQVRDVAKTKGLWEGIKAPFRSGGLLNARDTFWQRMPENAGLGGKALTWAGRAFGTILPAYGVVQAARGQAGDPNESRLTNTLGALGGAVGTAYGFPLAGMLGAGHLARATSAIGTGIGRAISPRPPPQPQVEPPQQYPQQYQQPYQQHQAPYAGY